MVEPRARIGETDGLVAEQIADRALEADRRRVPGAHRGEAAVMDRERQDLRPGSIAHGHVHAIGLAEQRHQIGLAAAECFGLRDPGFRIDDATRPGARCGAGAFR